MKLMNFNFYLYLELKFSKMSRYNNDPLVGCILPVWPEVLMCGINIRRMEIYKSGVLLLCPDDFYCTEDEINSWLWMYEWYIEGYVPEFCITMLNDNYNMHIFSLNSLYYIIINDRIRQIGSRDFDYVSDRIFTYSEFLSDNCRDFPYIVPQSGMNEHIDLDYKYSKSKTRKRWKNKKLVQEKLEKVSDQLKDANLGSRKNRTKKKFKKKLRTNHVKPQSGSDDFYEDMQIGRAHV